MAKQDELVFLPLGGVGEIGMNLALYGYGPPTHRQWITPATSSLVDWKKE